MIGAGYQRCRVHFLRNVFAVIRRQAAEMVAATIRTIFTQPTADAVHTHLHTVADMLGTQFPKVKAMLLEAEHDLTAFAAFPERHWKKIWSTNPLERVNREIKRRIDVVQVFPNDDALLRLVTAVLFEMHDEWIVFPRRYLPEGSMDTLYPNELPEQRPRTTQHHQRAHRIDRLHQIKGHLVAILPVGDQVGLLSARFPLERSDIDDRSELFEVKYPHEIRVGPRPEAKCSARWSAEVGCSPRLAGEARPGFCRERNRRQQHPGEANERHRRLRSRQKSGCLRGQARGTANRTSTTQQTSRSPTDPSLP
jgi:hypothetical protein